MSDLNLLQYAFPANQFFATAHSKTQIYLHHTAGNPSGKGVFDWWKTNTVQVATCVAISGNGSGTVDGQIVKGFDPKYWAYHLGLTNDPFKKFKLPYKQLDKISIGIEICNWGCLTKTDRGYESWAHTLVSEKEIIEYKTPFKNYKFYQKYTEKQIDSVKKLLIEWGKTFNIPISFKGMEIFDLDKRALNGDAGVFTHCSVRSDKSDIHPQPEMIAMLKSL